MSNITRKQVLKDALNWTKQTYLSKPHELRSLHGICKAVNHYCCNVIELDYFSEHTVSSLLSTLITLWPQCETYPFKNQSGEYIRNYSFPVSTHAQWLREAKTGTIWKNLKRLELLEYLIQEVNKDE